MAKSIFSAGTNVTITGTGFAADPFVVNAVDPKLAANGKGFVNHGAVAGTARPTGFASIEWYGSVEPTNAITGDTWIDVS